MNERKFELEKTESIEKKCFRFIQSEYSDKGDSAHDITHIKRVVKNAKTILSEEKADAEVVIAAAWLHDCIIVSKDHPDQKKASSLAAEKAADFLTGIDFPTPKIHQVKHAIKAHSYSAGIEAATIEAKIVQDADRLDALGAVGIARCLMIGGKLDRPLYNSEDPFCENRQPDDETWTLDHFYEKLFKLPNLMHTLAAKREAERRIQFMKNYLKELQREI